MEKTYCLNYWCWFSRKDAYTTTLVELKDFVGVYCIIMPKGSSQWKTDVKHKLTLSRPLTVPSKDTKQDKASTKGKVMIE
jgi:hypothetical protein